MPITKKFMFPSVETAVQRAQVDLKKPKNRVFCEYLHQSNIDHPFFCAGSSQDFSLGCMLKRVTDFYGYLLSSAETPPTVPADNLKGNVTRGVTGQNLERREVGCAPGVLWSSSDSPARARAPSNPPF